MTFLHRNGLLPDKSPSNELFSGRTSFGRTKVSDFLQLRIGDGLLLNRMHQRGWPVRTAMFHAPEDVPRASATARCEPIPAFPLTPGLSVCPVPHSAASASARCEPFPAFPLTPGLSVCPVPLSAASATARYEPFPAFPLTPGRHFARQPETAAPQPASQQAAD